MRLLILCAFAASVFAQPRFDSASIKPNKSGDMNASMNTRPDNVEAKNMTLHDLLVQAFEIKDYQLVGPEWLSSVRFDLVAKAPLGTGDDEKLMPPLRALLTERFKLQTHKETRELPCFALVPAKGGLLVKEVEPGDGNINASSNQNGGELHVKKMTMDAITEWLSREMERPVIDATGAKGAYDFTLKYSKENSNRVMGPETYPILTLALQEQLGLRLEKRTSQVPVIVIDHAERAPVEN